ncbi:MAG: peptidyl-prolyl cis-trans isomerase [Xanthomonadales bacterium]|nr:peptidyl-prolyl cis-trans isomerase [Xanthomonadales bacterium]
MRLTSVIASLLLGAALGAGIVWWWLKPANDDIATPSQWVARVGDSYISVDRYRTEMQRRGGSLPGQFHSEEQKLALLDELVYQQALVEHARREGIDRLPEVRRSIDQILAGQVLRRDLREQQEKVQVSDAMVRAFYDANADSYQVPERRRIAMIRIGVADGADPARWDDAEQRITQARKEALALDDDVTHFGDVARTFSDDQASRYRGGVVGWIATDTPERYARDPVVLEAAAALPEPGDLSAPLRGKDGWYLVRLVDLQPSRARPFEELEAGIRQRLRQEGMKSLEQSFRQQVVSELHPTLRKDVLAGIESSAPPAHDGTPVPPALPSKG